MNLTNTEINLQELLETLKRIENSISPARTWLSVPELADYIKSSESTIRRLISSGSIPFHRVGENGKIIFHRRQIDLWLLTGEKQPGKRTRTLFKEFL